MPRELKIRPGTCKQIIIANAHPRIFRAVQRDVVCACARVSQPPAQCSHDISWLITWSLFCACTGFCYNQRAVFSLHFITSSQKLGQVLERLNQI